MIAQCLLIGKFLRGLAIGLRVPPIPTIVALTRGNLFEETSDEESLQAAIHWLSRAHDVCGRSGVSAVYYIGRGWDVPYPETSGYIISTFLAYAEISKRSEFHERAQQIGDWELQVQHESGGVLSRPGINITRVFNTGQVILGWIDLFHKTGNQQYLDGAVRAGDYLVAIQEPDGSWIRDTLCGPRTYHARNCWALLRLFQCTGNEPYRISAQRNLRWVLAQRLPNGWFRNCGLLFDTPITHVIDYTLRGLLEAFALCAQSGFPQEPGTLEAVRQCVDAIISSTKMAPISGIEGMIPSSFDEDWHPGSEDSCLTGSAQLAILMYRLAQITSESLYATYANSIVRVLKKTQLIDTCIPDLNGALPGSYPIFTGYHPCAFPNWATKFFVDALLMKTHHLSGLIIYA